MKPRNVFWGLILLVGCNVQQLPDMQPHVTPDNTKKSPAESYFEALAAWNDAKRFGSVREMAMVVNQLIQTNQLSDVDRQKIEAAFPKMAKDNRKMTSADSDTLRNLK